MSRRRGAYKALGKARANLAAKSMPAAHRLPGGPVYASLAASRAAWFADPDVVGVGLGRRPHTSDLTLSVFVRGTLADLAESRPCNFDVELAERVPAAASARVHGLGLELIRFGEVRSRSERGGAPATQARGFARELGAVTLAAGDGVGQSSPASRGTLGSLARMPTGEIVGITAKHVIDGGDLRDGDPPVAMVSRRSLDDPGARRIGEVDRGTRTGIDAARIRFDAAVDPSWVIPTVGPIAGWRPPVAGDIGQGASIVGARSGRLDGTIRHLHVEFPQLHLSDVILAEIPTEDGDSGAALLDSNRFVLGFLVGVSTAIDRSLRLFSPAESVLSYLGCNIP